MTDPRTTPFSGRIALSGALKLADAETEGTLARVISAVADLCRRPDGPRDRQVLRGARVRVIDQQGAHVFVQSQADGYCGWLQAESLGHDHPVTHRISALATHLYTRPDLKSPETTCLSHGSLLLLGDRSDNFLQTESGQWVPSAHVTPLGHAASDPIAVARQFLGVPYLWGGNSSWGIDCSGLVQACLHACASPCPGDSDLQLAAFGAAHSAVIDAETSFVRGDLLFWKGHVAWVSAPDMILHATAHGMAVIEEPLREACARIDEQAKLLAHVRLNLVSGQRQFFPD